MVSVSEIRVAVSGRGQRRSAQHAIEKADGLWRGKCGYRVGFERDGGR